MTQDVPHTPAPGPRHKEPKPTHEWNDPNDDGHDCADCGPESMWKCDPLAHVLLPPSPYGLLPEAERADLFRALEDGAAERRRGAASAGSIPLAGTPDPTAAGRPDLTPFTEAGRSAVDFLTHDIWCANVVSDGPCDCTLAEHILAVEAEARRARLAQGRAEALDATLLGTAMDMVTEEDERLGVLGRGRYVDRVIERYAALGGNPDD